MVRKSEKLVCAYLLLIGAKFTDSFEMRNLLFTAQELIDKANEIFGESIKSKAYILEYKDVSYVSFTEYIILT